MFGQRDQRGWIFFSPVFFCFFQLLHTSNVLRRPISGFANSCVTFLTLAAGTLEKLKGAFRCQTGAPSESCVGGPEDESENLPSQAELDFRPSLSITTTFFPEWETNCCSCLNTDSAADA